MSAPHLWTMLGAIFAATCAFYWRGARPKGARVVTAVVGAIIGAGGGALIEAGGLQALAAFDWSSPRMLELRGAIARIEWRDLLGRMLRDEDMRWVPIMVALVIVVPIVLTLIGFGRAVRTAFRRTMVWLGVGLALVASAGILVGTKLPAANVEGGWMLVVAAMLGAGMLNGLLFGSRHGVYWRLSGAEPVFVAARDEGGAPRAVTWGMRHILTRVVKAPPDEVERAIAAMEQGGGPATAGGFETEITWGRRERGDDGVKISWQTSGSIGSSAGETTLPLRDARHADALLAALRAQRATPVQLEFRRQKTLAIAIVTLVAIMMGGFWIAGWF